MSNESTRIEKTKRAYCESGYAFGARAGSAMLEYVIVLGALAIGLVAFMNHAFYDHVNGFGPLGQGLVALYQRMFAGLALPIP